MSILFRLGIRCFGPEATAPPSLKIPWNLSFFTVANLPTDVFKRGQTFRLRCLDAEGGLWTACHGAVENPTDD